MTDVVLADLALVDRIEETVAACTRLRLGVIAQRPGNPARAETRRFGTAVAFRAPGVPVDNFNVIAGLSDNDADSAAELIAWFADAGAPARFMFAPGRPIGRIARALADAGFAHTAFHGALAGRPMPSGETAPGVSVRRVETVDDIPTFEDAYHAGWEVSGRRAPTEPWRSLPGWSLYTGFVDGRPAGGAILFVHEGVGYLADAAVAPAFRGRGLHRAFLDRRIADAKAAGCDLICAGAAFPSTSLRNMQRAGLAVAYTRAVWT